MGIEFKKPLIIGDIDASAKEDISQIKQDIGDLSQLDTADKSSLVNALNEAIDSTLNGASRNLDNLSDAGNDKLRSLNAYANEGELLTDPDGLAFVEKYAHSTFDKSKFTVVGSPVITDDGIASGFSSSNYLTINPTINLSNFKIKGRVNINNDVYNQANNYPSIAFCFKNTNSQYRNRLVFYSDSSKGLAFAYHLQDGSDSATNLRITIPSVGIYDYEFSYNGSMYTLIVKDSLGQIIDSATLTSTSLLDVTNTELLIGEGNVEANIVMWRGSIDLKQFSITVDGVPVFSGNKTGIDTIKPTNFTVVTNSMKAFVYNDGTNDHIIYANSDTAPIELYNADGTIRPQSASEWQIDGTTVKYNGNAATYTSGSNITSVANPPLPFNAGLKITEDGVASGFGSANYIKTGFQLPSSCSLYKEFISFKTGNDVTTAQNLRGSNTNSSAPSTNNNTNNIFIEAGYLKIRQTTTGTSWDLSFDNIPVISNTNYTFIIEWNGSVYNYTLKSGDTTIATKTLINSNFYITNTLYLGNSDWFTLSRPFLGSIDLNAFKIYVDGNLVYQPCLKIPYTESKTGSKIVDSIYRDRVNDMAEQFGYANYYTLDEDNGNFTLPRVELYGLIGQRTLRDSYRNGATYWELWSDRTLEIGGTCTSGVEYNLPKNFTSENDYILSVPYSAKTASSFIPTASGDFIAKGLGVL